MEQEKVVMAEDNPTEMKDKPEPRRPGDQTKREASKRSPTKKAMKKASKK